MTEQDAKILIIWILESIPSNINIADCTSLVTKLMTRVVYWHHRRRWSTLYQWKCWALVEKGSVPQCCRIISL